MRKALDIILACLVVGAAFLAVNLLHFWFFPVSVILYACALDLVIALIPSVPLILLLFTRRRRLSPSETTLTVLLAGSLVMFYAVMGPTVIDRSLSIYILEKLDQRGGAVAMSKVPDVFIREYMPEYRLVDVRITEQLTSGTARVDGECLVLTPRGKFIADAMNAYRGLFLPRKRILMGEMTDQLTHPFDNAPRQVDVSCRRASQIGR